MNRKVDAKVILGQNCRHFRHCHLRRHELPSLCVSERERERRRTDFYCKAKGRYGPWSPYTQVQKAIEKKNKKTST